MSKQFTFAVMTALLLVSVGSPAMREVYVFGNPARFDRLAQAPAVPIPDSQTAFPGTNCGIGDRGPTGAGPSVQIRSQNTHLSCDFLTKDTPTASFDIVQ
jgi:hypothetical protein